MAKKDAITPIKVSTVGLDERSLEVLRIAFFGSAKGACTLTGAADADVTICNMDSSNAEALWQRFREKYTQRPTIVIALRNPKLEDTLFVAKPINIEQLIKSVKQAHRHGTATPRNAPSGQTGSTNNTPQPVTSTPMKSSANHALKIEAHEEAVTDIKWRELNEDPISYYVPEELLQGAINELSELAQSRQTAAQLSIMIGEQWQKITFDPINNRVLSEIDDDKLEKLCSMPRFCIATRTTRLSKKETELEMYRSEEATHSATIEQFLWKIALWSSAGRLPQGTRPTNPIELSYCPNLTRLQPTPNSIRIAVLLSQQPGTPALIAKVLNIPIAHVFSFFAASQALGLATSFASKPKTEKRFNPPTPNRHHSLFGKILNHLGANSG